jgi:hypothetical protein
MTPISLSILLLGIISGIIGGALGPTGPALLLPGILLLGIAPNFKTAVGTVLLAILPPLSLLAVYEYYKKDLILINVSILLMIGYFLGSYFGAYITINNNANIIQFVNGIIFLLLGVFFLRLSMKSPNV